MEVIIKPCCKCEYFKNYAPYGDSICKHPSSIKSIDKVDGTVDYKSCEYIRARLEGNCPNFVYKGVSNFIVILVILCVIGVYKCF